jgi:hypothetical protein
LSLKLNIGAGSTRIEGWTPIDRDLGTEAYPLPYEDNSVDEIRASHILEHFSFRDAIEAVKEWARVLKPGGRIRIAVPGFEQISQMSGHDDKWMFYLMGGQTDENDFHRSVWDTGMLTRVMREARLENIQPFQSHINDTASLPCSLNLEATKPLMEAQKVKICAVMSLPRVGWNDAWGQIQESLAVFQIPLHRFTGVFWGQCMQRVFNDAVRNGVDWILTIDYDSMFTAQHLDQLLGTLGQNPHIDALASMQVRRGQKYPLMTKTGATKKLLPCVGGCGHEIEVLVAEIDNAPIQVATAHFGLTLLRVDALKDVEKPWFYAQPDENCEWEPDGEKLDDDIWFWHQWKKAGKTLFVDPNCRIGHLEVMVSEMGQNMEPRHLYVTDWRKEHNLDRKQSNDGSPDTTVGNESTPDGPRSQPQPSGEFDSTRRVSPSWRTANAGTGTGNGDSDAASRNGHVAEPEAAGASA